MLPFLIESPKLGATKQWPQNVRMFMCALSFNATQMLVAYAKMTSNIYIPTHQLDMPSPLHCTDSPVCVRWLLDSQSAAGAQRGAAVEKV